MTFSFQRLFYVLSSIAIFIALLFYGKTLLVPITTGLLISFILYPAVKKVERLRVGRIGSISLVMIVVTLITVATGIVLSSQIIRITADFDDFFNKMIQLINSVVTFFNKEVAFTPDVKTQTILTGIKNYFTDSGLFIVSDTLSVTGTFLSWCLLSLIYTFLILLYRKSFVNALVGFVSEENKDQFYNMLQGIQKVGQQYVSGMIALILLLGVLNTTALSIIGIDYAFFFGFLAALLTIIPYIGTSLGGLFPTIYAFLNYDSYWYPAGVVLAFWFIQTLEGNFLSPKIIGGKLDLNAFTSIIALILGALIWGVPGMILFLPFTATFKIICDYYKPLEPLGILMGDPETNKSKKSKLTLSKIIDQLNSKIQRRSSENH
ncbi:MAG: AI-2E family transporter [Bacteroidota bacterium]